MTGKQFGKKEIITKFNIAKIKKINKMSKKTKKQPFKKALYLLLSTLLGTILSFIAHAAIEMIYLKYLEDNNIEVIPAYFFGKTAWCALPLWIQASLLVIGIIGGYLLGLTWWKWVYVDKKHRKFRKQNKKSG